MLEDSCVVGLWCIREELGKGYSGCWRTVALWSYGA